MIDPRNEALARLAFGWTRTAGDAAGSGRTPTGRKESQAAGLPGR